MAARTRWALSPDRCAIVVVEDPTAVEAEPVANGVVFGREGWGFARLDGVWDAAPDPTWTRLAFGRAFVVSAGERDSLTTAQWDSLARAADMPVADVRRGAFEASGMAVAKGFAQPGVVELQRSGDRMERRRTFPVAAGWRVGWSTDGSTLAAGRKSAVRVQDDAPADRWLALDPATGIPGGELPPGARLYEPAWVEGPTIDISQRHDLTSAPAIAVDGGTITSDGGRIALRGRDVGPGIALAASRHGRFIVALAPDTTAKEYDPKEHLVVYVVP
jgi:hypothetical protein